MPNVLIVNYGEDTGGVSIGIKRAFERHNSDWKIRTIRGSNNYIDYPADQTGPLSKFPDLWEWADVIHTMQKLTPITAYQNPPGKPVVLHHHGTIYRVGHSEFDRVANDHGLVQLCSTIDLTMYNSNVKWLPNPIDIDLMQSIRKQYQPPTQPHPMTFSHSPTVRSVKGSDVFIGASRTVGTRMILIEKKPWLTALGIKATADAVMDQLTYGYGLSGLEAMAMGVPVVGGLLDEVRPLFESTLGELPFLDVNKTNIVPQLKELIYTDLYWTIADRGHEYVKKYHSQENVVKQLIGYYQQAIDTYRPEQAWP